MMIGPSAPNGPPVPIEMAEDRGLSIATFGDIRLLPNRIASIASGMPWPRIFSDPKRAISPMTSPPIAGAKTIQPMGEGVGERQRLEAERTEPDQVGDQRDGLSRAHAAPTLPAPTSEAMPIRTSTRLSVVKSPSRCNGLAE